MLLLKTLRLSAAKSKEAYFNYEATCTWGGGGANVLISVSSSLRHPLGIGRLLVSHVRSYFFHVTHKPKMCQVPDTPTFLRRLNINGDCLLTVTMTLVNAL